MYEQAPFTVLGLWKELFFDDDISCQRRNRVVKFCYGTIVLQGGVSMLFC